MAVSVGEICENTKLAREMALMGNYESALVYYEGTVQMIHRLLITIADTTRKSKWQLTPMAGLPHENGERSKGQSSISRDPDWPPTNRSAQVPLARRRRAGSAGATSDGLAGEL
ncbi:Katanin p60 ATPase-containing subunit [Papilio xuthus]|uniref:Katanin p60 ATPase-containing subunit n=1 Tax=Papilio xuthus TaxID=66420 RepID=A0A194PLF9_PAPXU|nr:Katanin p60 ATPase-containing subunit [Papilio xuthus]